MSDEKLYQKIINSPTFEKIFFLILFMWIFWGIFWPGTVIIFSVGLLSIKSLKQLCIYCIACPLIFIPAQSALNAGWGYINGTAIILNSSATSPPPYQNLDREFRCKKSMNNACIRYGNEPLYKVPNDFVLKNLIKILGPMPNSYTGFYPTHAESLEIIENEYSIVSSEDLSKGYITIDGVEFKVNRGLIFFLKDFRTEEENEDDIFYYRVNNIDQGCLMFKRDKSEITKILLIDSEHSKFIALYNKPNKR